MGECVCVCERVCASACVCVQTNVSAFVESSRVFSAQCVWRNVCVCWIHIRACMCMCKCVRVCVATLVLVRKKCLWCVQPVDSILHSFHPCVVAVSKFLVLALFLGLARALARAPHFNSVMADPNPRPLTPHPPTHTISLPSTSVGFRVVVRDRRHLHRRDLEAE